MFRWLKRRKVVAQPRHPLMPDWRPDIMQPLDRVVERLRAYTEGTRDLAVFQHGTAVLLPDRLDDVAAEALARVALLRIFQSHPDMDPVPMHDGNLLVRYGDRVANLVLADTVRQHRDAIEANHMRALVPGEVLLTPQGANVFDDVGKQALFGRCYLFMDAQAPRIARIVRFGQG